MTTLTRTCTVLACASAALLIATRPMPLAQAQTPKQETTSGSASTFAIDATHSMALFRVRHLGAGAFWGRFNAVTGTIEHDAGSPSGLSLDVEIAIDSIDTGSEGLDGHLKSPDFFNAAEHAKATFKSRSAKKTGERTYSVEGDFTLHGVTKTISANVEWLGTRAGGRGERCGFETTFTVKRSEYGMLYGVEQNALGDETRIVVALEGLRQSGEQAGRGGGQRNPFARMDSNGDGKLQKDELPERMQGRFEELDTNGDGALDQEELQALRRGGGR
jgi:polyisoprenoid-binding protein YceI